MVKLTGIDGSVLECSVEEYMQIAKGAGIETPTLGENEIEVDGVIYEKVDDEAKKGDYIVYDEVPRSYLTSGKPYVVKFVDDCDDAHIKDDEGDDFDTSGDEFKVYRKKAPFTTVEVLSNENAEIGDKFVVLNSETNNFHVGEVVTLIEKDTIQTYPEFKRDYDGLQQVVSYDNVRRATQEEIEAKTPDDREQSFFKFGREVDDFRVGDVVELIKKPTNSNGYDIVGTLHYIDEVNDAVETAHLKHVAPRKEGRNTHTILSDIKLVAPVERLS